MTGTCTSAGWSWGTWFTQYPNQHVWYKVLLDVFAQVMFELGEHTVFSDMLHCHAPPLGEDNTNVVHSK
jgi:hypothetical protein